MSKPTTWLISDTHFGHDKIITFEGYGHKIMRPFSSIDEMNDEIVYNWNRVVEKNDLVYHLGDVAWHRRDLHIISKLNGRKHLILGNHDNLGATYYLLAGFDGLHGLKTVNAGRGQHVVLSHAPVHPTTIERVRTELLGNIHGHIHEMDPPPGPYLNVSVERTDYTPVTLDWAVDHLRAKAAETAPQLGGVP